MGESASQDERGKDPEAKQDVTQADKPKKKMSPQAKAILATVLVLAVVVGAIFLFRYQTHSKYQQSTDDAYVQADTVAVAPKVSGYVDELLVVDNQVVKAGQPLVRIDPRDFIAQRSQNLAQVESADATVDSARAALVEQGAAIAQAEAQLKSSRQEAAHAVVEAERYAPLAATGAETRERLATLQKQAEQAVVAVASQNAALAAARLHVGSLQGQVRQAIAQGKTARAQLEAAEVNLGSTEVRASIDGRVGDKQVRQGQYVSAGTRMMVVVPQVVYIAANFKETQIGLMRVGQSAKIKLDALPDATFDGRVESVSPGTGSQFSLIPPQNATGNFTKIVQRVPVRIAVDVGPRVRELLAAGLSVTVSVDTLPARGDLKDRSDADKDPRP